MKKWVVGSIFLGCLVMIPVVAVVVFAFGSSGDIWSHLLATSLPYYIENTILLMLGVGTIVFLIGVTTAWLVTMCQFPGRRIFEWLLLLPLAIPSYVIAYAYTDFFEYGGAVQRGLRYLFNWQSAQDYYFPEIRSLGGAIVVMGLVLYPYVYLLARSAFLEQSVNVLEVGRVLGRGSWSVFSSISLPAARPAIVVGVTLALMETLSDFGTVDYFAVYTMTAGLVDVWLGMGSLAGGAQIATTMLVFVLILITVERISRRRQRVYQQPSSRFKPLPTYKLSKFKSLGAFTFCLIPVFGGFILPVLILGRLTTVYFSESWTSDFMYYIWNSLSLSFIAAGLALCIALFLSYGRRLTKNRILTVVCKIASLGYAVPGAVLAVGILVPLAAFDNSVDAFMRQYFGFSTGLILSGTIVAVLFAYTVKFLAISLGQIESSLDKVSPSMDMAARTLGYRTSHALMKYHLPLIKSGMLTALMIVFVDCMKELPATILLRPFNFDTLATHVYEFASDEMLGEAALGSLTIVGIGLVPVLLLSKIIAKSRDQILLQSD